MKHESAIREPLIIGNKTLHDISEDIAKPIEDYQIKNTKYHISFGYSF